MDQAKAKALLPIITAFAEGKKIEFKGAAPKSQWDVVGTISFAYLPEQYRIKEEEIEVEVWDVYAYRPDWSVKVAFIAAGVSKEKAQLVKESHQQAGWTHFSMTPRTIRLTK